MDLKKNYDKGWLAYVFRLSVCQIFMIIQLGFARADYLQWLFDQKNYLEWKLTEAVKGMNDRERCLVIGWMVSQGWVVK